MTDIDIQCPSLDSGSNFLSGQPTSAFQSLSPSGLVEGVSSIQNQAFDVMNKVMNTGNSLMEGAIGTVGSMTGTVMGAGMNAMGFASNIPGVITNMISNLTSYSINTLSSKLSPLITPPMPEIGYWTGVYFTYYFAEFTKDKLVHNTEESEKLIDEKNENEHKESIDKLTKKLNDSFSKAKKIIDGCVEKANKAMDDINNFSLAGEEWVGRQIDKIQHDAENCVYKFVEKEEKKLKDARDAFAQKAGEKMGKGNAEVAAKAVIQANKNGLDEAANKVQKGVTTAKTLAQTAVMQVLALLGV